MKRRWYRFAVVGADPATVEVDDLATAARLWEQTNGGLRPVDTPTNDGYWVAAYAWASAVGPFRKDPFNTSADYVLVVSPSGNATWRSIG